MAPSRLMEVRVGPRTITVHGERSRRAEVYAECLSEDAMSWEESLRERSRRRQRNRQVLRVLLAGMAPAAAGRDGGAGLAAAPAVGGRRGIGGGPRLRG